MTLDNIRQRIIDLACHASVEISLHASLAQLGRAGSRLLYIPSFFHTPPLTSTIAMALRLKEKGFNPVPHIAARNYETSHDLEKALESLQKSGLSRILLIAGDRRKCGPYPNTLTILSTGLLAKYGITHIDFAGHPFGNPHAKDQSITNDALRTKNAFVQNSKNIYSSLMTQLSFDIDKISHWAQHIQLNLDNTLPITAGICGVLRKPSQVFRAASLCGFDATQLLANAFGMFLSFARNGVPTIEIVDCAQNESISSMHFYTFGKTAATLEMLDKLEQGRFEVKRNMFGSYSLKIIP